MTSADNSDTADGSEPGPQEDTQVQTVMQATEPPAAGQVGIDGQALKLLEIEPPGEPSRRRSTRISAAPLRYQDNTPSRGCLSSTYTMPEEKNKEKFWKTKATHTGDVMEPLSPGDLPTHPTDISKAPPKLVEHGTPTMVISIKSEKDTLKLASVKVRGRSQKRPRDGEPATEILQQKPPPQKSQKATPRITTKARTPAISRPLTRKTRLQNILSAADMAVSLVESPVIDSLNTKSPITRSSQPLLPNNFPHEFLRDIVGDATKHYLSLPKDLPDPLAVQSLYRTFFPTNMYQRYLKEHGLRGNDDDVRAIMREVWGLVNGGEHDTKGVWEKLHATRTWAR